MIITLNYSAPLGLPSGVTLQPGVPTVVHGWASDKKSKVVQAWLKKGILREGDGLRSQFMPESGAVAGDETANKESAAPAEEGQGGAEQGGTGVQGQQAQSEQHVDEKAELLAELEKRGIKADKRSGVKKLREILDAAPAAGRDS